MDYLACAFAAVLVLYASGLGFTLFLLPANLRVYSLIVAPWAGFSYMTLGCWYLYALGGNLTILFVGPILIPPLLCLTGAVALQDIRRGLPGIVFNRNVFCALLVAAAVFVFFSVPLLTHARGLSPISLSNYDDAISAPYTRLLIEF